jgi:hypothetical protein
LLSQYSNPRTSRGVAVGKSICRLVAPFGGVSRENEYTNARLQAVDPLASFEGQIVSEVKVPPVKVPFGPASDLGV